MGTRGPQFFCVLTRGDPKPLKEQSAVAGVLILTAMLPKNIVDGDDHNDEEND